MDYLNVCEVELTYKTKIKSSERAKVTQSNDAAKIFLSIYDMNKIEHKEIMYAMYINRNNKVLGVLLISEGGISGTVCDTKIVFQGALKTNASVVILCHNHPSGNLKASDADIEVFKKLKQAGQIMDIAVHDSIIVTPEGKYLSMADEGY